MDYSKLFRAIVLLGAALTACDDEDCHKCAPIDAAADTVAAGDARDGGIDAPKDAPADAVIIL